MNDYRLNDSIIPLFPWDKDGHRITHVNFENCSLSKIPMEFLSCPNLTSIQLQGNPLEGISKSLITLKTSDMLKSLEALFLSPPVPCFRMKMIVIGEAAAGKTSLVRSLQRIYSKNVDETKITSTDGIDLGKLKVGDFVCNCYDFAGQELYTYTHQFFLTNQSICLVLFNLSTPLEEERLHLIHWLESVKSHAPECGCVLIGTHLSLVGNSEGKRRCLEQFEYVHSLYPFVTHWISVDSITGDGVTQVSKVLKELFDQKVLIFSFVWLFLTCFHSNFKFPLLLNLCIPN